MAEVLGSHSRSMLVPGGHWRREFVTNATKPSFAIATRGDHLGHLVRSWRERLRPDAISTFGGATRRKRSVSQEDMARMIGSSSHWYARLERGDTDIYSADFLDRTAAALGLSPAERRLLYLYALRHEPVHIDPPEPVSVPARLRKFVREQPYPAYICDESWRILDYNDQIAEWFPWISVADEPNIMRWAFTAPDARVQLHHWDSDWVPLLLAQLMAARARYPNAACLDDLIREILDANELARAIWSRGPQPPSEPAGEHRQLRVLRYDRPQAVDLITLAPAQTPPMKIILIVPV
jgi:transcriptional regulator with XRE-family HTH domain